ncbi:hypothetical protein [Fontivita pretiosa]|uniref:hypothetical protein n=1 Tax=Fontivita pretiosa TaxID=2989684 RepID=UPI003D182F3C
MPITCTEKFESRAGDSSSIDLIYNVVGTDDDQAARTALAAAAPSTHAGLVQESVHVEPLGELLWEGRVRYTRIDLQSPQTGDASFSFDTTGGTQHVTQSRQTVQKYAPAGQIAPDFGGAIGVTHDSVEGVDITVPVFSFSVTRYIAAASMTPAYIATLYALTGKVNNAAWTVNADGVNLTFAAGEALFQGVSGSKRKSENDWELNFRFAASPNTTNLTVGSITGIAKKGWEYLWVRYADAEDTAAKAIVKKPIAAYIEKVYDEGNFAGLGIS